jgi:hypothetical protein
MWNHFNQNYSLAIKLQSKAFFFVKWSIVSMCNWMVSHVFRLCVLTWLTNVLCFISKSIQVKQITFDLYLPDNTNLGQLKVGVCFWSKSLGEKNNALYLSSFSNKYILLCTCSSWILFQRRSLYTSLNPNSQSPIKTLIFFIIYTNIPINGKNGRYPTFFIRFLPSKVTLLSDQILYTFRL